MSNWLERVGALLGSRAHAPRVAVPVIPRVAKPRVPAAVVASPTPPLVPGPVVDAELHHPLFDWLTGTGPALATSLHDSEIRLLAQLDAVLASDTARNALLPRAPAVIPQLMNCLRDESQSAEGLAQRVAKDPHLVAEVIRMANSVQTRAAEPVVGLAEAIGRLGTEGLRRAIARVVLKPMFAGDADSLSARAAARLWQHSEAQAVACQEAGVARGLAPFDGYLAGLMHNIGWSATLRAIDRSEGGASKQYSRAFIEALAPRRERLFALLVMPWQLTDTLTALGAELLAIESLAGTRSPLGQALHTAQVQATQQLLGDAINLADSVAVEVDAGIITRH